MKFDYVYFNKNFLKYLELLVYSLKNKRINIIKDLKQVRDIVRNAFHLKDCPPDEKNNLIQTINEYYKGLDTIRTNPLWRSHIDVAIAVFNNRLQTTTEIVNSESLKKDNLMISIINELLSNDGRDLDEKKKKKMVSFFERAIQRKSYKLACTFLRRIPKLEKSDVKEIYKCVLEYLIDEYNYTATKNNKCCLQSLITDDFKSDRGPLANMLDDTENPEALKDLFDTWKTIDKDMPLIGNLNNTINPNPRKHVFSCITIISDSEDEDQTYYYSKRARVEPIPRCQTPSLQRSNLGSLQSTPTTSSPSTSNPKLLQNQTPNLQSSSLDLSTSLPNSVGETKKNCPEERNNESAFGDSRHNASSNNKKPEEIIKTGINTPLDTVSSAAPPPINSSSLVNRISSPPTEVFSERRKENLNEKNDAPVQKNDTPVSKNAEQTKQKDNSFVADNTVLYIKTFLAIPQCTLANDFGQLLKTPALSDVVFIVGQEKVKILAHIAIVSARSEVLREKIKEVRKGLKASDDFPVLEVTLEDVSPKAFEVVLKYIYTDRIEVSRKEKVFLLINIHRLAEQLKIKRLEHLSTTFFLKILNLSNAIDALKYADSKKLNSIKELCLNFISEDSIYCQIIEMPEFETMTPTILVEIMRKHLKNGSNSIQPDFPLVTGTVLEKDMEVFLSRTGQEFSDVTLELDGVKILAHKAVLAARCNYFKELFCASNSVNNVIIGKKEYGPSQESFKSLLQYIYCGGISMIPESLLCLFEGSLLYKFTNDRLQRLFQQNLEKCVTIQNIIDILEISNKYKENEVKSFALNFIEKNLKEVVSLPKIELLDGKLSLEILKTIAAER